MNHVLIFTGGLHPPKKTLDWLFALKGDPDFIIAADSGLDLAKSFGCRPDLIVGDMDSLSSRDTLVSYPKKSVQVYPCDKDKTDTELAMESAWKTRAKTITLFGGDGMRLDHSFAILQSFSGKIYPHLWLCKEQVVFLMQPDSRGGVFELEFANLKQQDIISVFAVSAENCTYRIQSEGLEWPLERVDWAKGAYSLSNRLKDEFSEKGLAPIIRVKSGRFLAFMPYV